MPDEPQLFPNQPSPEEHVQAHKGDAPSPFEPQAVGLNEIATRLKILEERYSTIRKKSLVAEQNIIESDKEFYEDIRLINDSIMELKHSLRDLAEKVGLLSEEVNNFATRNEFNVLDRYVSFWEPMDFVTRKEVNDFLRRRFRQEPKAVTATQVSRKDEPSVPPARSFDNVPSEEEVVEQEKN